MVHLWTPRNKPDVWNCRKFERGQTYPTGDIRSIYSNHSNSRLIVDRFCGIHLYTSYILHPFIWESLHPFTIVFLLKGPCKTTLNFRILFSSNAITTCNSTNQVTTYNLSILRRQGQFGHAHAHEQTNAGFQAYTRPFHETAIWVYHPNLSVRELVVPIWWMPIERFLLYSSSVAASCRGPVYPNLTHASYHFPYFGNSFNQSLGIGGNMPSLTRR